MIEPGAMVREARARDRGQGPRTRQRWPGTNEPAAKVHEPAIEPAAIASQGARKPG